MSLNIWNLEWLNHNSQRAYPIADWATRTCSESNAVQLPNDFILALSIAVNSCHSLNIDKFYVKSVLVMESGCTVLIGYEGQDVAVTHILASANQSCWSLTGIGDFDDIVGFIGINPQSSLLQNLSGYYNFTWEATALEPDCIRPMIKTISSIQIEDGPRLYGDIVLKAGANMDISVSTVNNVSTITFSAIDGSGMTQSCQCAENSSMTPITSINGIEPDSGGNITITGTNCLQVSAANSGIYLEDTCAQPCCGCVELDALYDNLKDCLNGIATLNNTVENIDARQQQVELVYSTAGKTSCNCVEQSE